MHCACAGAPVAVRAGIKSMFRRKTKESLPQVSEHSTDAVSEHSAALTQQLSSAAVGKHAGSETAAFSASESQPVADQATVLPDTLPQNVPQASLSSKPILASFSGLSSSPTGSPDRAVTPQGLAGSDAFDPLSTAYEEHVSTPKPTPLRMSEEEAPVLPADFDPLAATYEEYNLWQMSQQQQQHREVGQHDTSVTQSPEASAPASPVAARKTRSIPGFFKKRKAAATSEASDTAGTQDTDLPPAGTTVAEDPAAASMQVQTSGSDAGSIPGSPASAKQQKSHKRGLSLLMRRTKSNLGAQKQAVPTDAAQMQPEPIQEEAPHVLAAAEQVIEIGLPCLHAVVHSSTLA